MNRIQEFLAHNAQRLADWLQGLGNSSQETIGPPPELQAPLDALPGVDEADTEAEEMVQVPRLVSGQLGIYVHCAACGILHELQAVCHVCGQPLCSDTANCRLIRHDRLLGGLAVFCPNCGSRSHAQEVSS